MSTTTSISQYALIAAIVASAVTIGGCSSTRQSADDPGPLAGIGVNSTPAKGTAEALYSEAKKALDKRQFETAVQRFEQLEATYPFGDYTAQAQLDIAYAYYKQTEYDSASATIDRYLKLHPRHESGDYAYYLLGLINFSAGKSILDSMVSRRLHQMDQASLREAHNNFATMTRKFPNSPYVEDAKKRMVVLRNAMARHELSTARYYYKRSAMVAVINRVNFMLEQYRDSSHTDDGLALMAQAHGALGNTALARATFLMLEQSNPDHPELSKLEKYKG